MQLPAEQVMATTGHRCEFQMRRDYSKWSTGADVRTRATIAMVRYISGKLPRIPQTAVEVYGELVNQLVSKSKLICTKS